MNNFYMSLCSMCQHNRKIELAEKLADIVELRKKAEEYGNRDFASGMGLETIKHLEEGIIKEIEESKKPGHYPCGKTECFDPPKIYQPDLDSEDND